MHAQTKLRIHDPLTGDPEMHQWPWLERNFSLTIFVVTKNHWKKHNLKLWSDSTVGLSQFPGWNRNWTTGFSGRGVRCFGIGGSCRGMMETVPVILLHSLKLTWNRISQKEIHLFQSSIFRCKLAVSFREGNVGFSEARGANGYPWPPQQQRLFKRDRCGRCGPSTLVKKGHTS